MAISRLQQTSLQNAFQKYNSVWDGRSAAGAMDAISSITIPSGGLANIEFNNIPQTYTHLQIRALSRNTYASLYTTSWYMYINGDTGTNYSNHNIRGDGSVAASNGYASSSSAYAGGYGSVAGDSVKNNMYGVSIVDILDYTNQNKYKTIRSLNGSDVNGAGAVALYSSNWRSTSPITSLKIFSDGNHVQYSTFTLYGIR